jgi:circadian clock protein KaiB
MVKSNAMAHAAGAHTNGDSGRWELDLYVVGATVLSLRAIANIEQICHSNLAGNYRIEVIDLDVHPEMAIENNISAIPTLVRRSPGPPRRVIGDLSDATKVLQGLELIEA